jgi:endoglycosylceramidase
MIPRQGRRNADLGAARIRRRRLGCGCLGILATGSLVCVLILVIVVVRSQRLDCNLLWEAGTVTASIPSPDTDVDALDWIHTDGQRFLDSAGNVTVLRGFVTVTNNGDGSPLNYTLEDYERMSELGANYQSIRVGAGLLGWCPGDVADPEYLERLDAMVFLAKQQGMYSQFKLTVYDIEGSIGLRQRRFWGAIWENDDAEQERFVEAWRTLWERYQDEPAVIGYDLLNEPLQGGVRGSEDDFIRDYLTPFYRDTIDELHTITDRHVAFIQPPFGAPPYNEPIQRDRVVYAPHFYPNLMRYLLLSDFSPRGYQATMERFAAEARLHGAPLFIGEYGMPWPTRRDGDESREEGYRDLEQAANDLFDQYQVGFSRPWFSDDRAGLTLFRIIELNWAVIRGEDGLDGEERRFITDVFATPYPRSLAGELTSFGFQHDRREFVMTYIPSTDRELTEIFVPRTVHYPGGFSLVYDDGTSVVYDPTEPTGLRLTANPAGLDPASFVWDEPSQSLFIREWVDGVPVTIQILRE